MREPRLVDLRGETPDAAVLEGVGLHLESGGLVAMPTETVYGFGCLVEPAHLLELQRLKGRRPDKPFLLLIPGMDAVPGLAWTAEAREFAKVFWPGALTLVLGDPEGTFPPGVRSPEGTVAVRVTPQVLARRVVETLGRPIVSTSANLPGGVPALDAGQVLETALSLGAGPELWILDGGPLGPSEPSTLIDCSGPGPRVLRAGAIPLHRLRCVIPEIHETA